RSGWIHLSTLSNFAGPLQDSHFPKPTYPNWTNAGVTWPAGFDSEIKVFPAFPKAIEGRHLIASHHWSNSIVTLMMAARVLRACRAGRSPYFTAAFKSRVK
ncbi:MAG: hypothetical protein V7730_10625, partial [Sulfitobacter sp.]